MIAVSSGFMGGGATVGADVGKDGACGVQLSGDGLWAQAGGGVGSADPIIGIVEGGGAGIGEGAVEWHIGVVGFKSVLVSMSEFMSICSWPGGGGVVRSRIVTFFFLVFLDFLILRGEGLAAFGVHTTRLRV